MWGAGVNAVFTAAYYFVLIAARTHGASPASVGLMLSLAGGCGLVGALVTPWVLRRVPAGRLVVGCSLAMVALVAPLGAVGSVWAYGALFGAALFVGPVLSVLFQTRAIALVPPELQGRTGSVMESAANAVQLVAPVTAGVLAGLLDPVAVGLLLAAVLLVLAGYARGGRRHLDDLPAAPVPTSVSQGD